MYLHLGGGAVARNDEIVGVFDLDNTTISKHTRALLARAQQEGRVVNVSAELPKSFILCVEGGVQTVYLSQLAPVTLLKRSRQI